MARTEQIALPEGLLTSATLKGVQLCLFAEDQDSGKRQRCVPQTVSCQKFKYCFMFCYSTTLQICMAGPELRLQCPGVVYEALTGSGQGLPYLLSVACGDATTNVVIACPDLKFDYEASFTVTGLMFLC